MKYIIGIISAAFTALLVALKLKSNKIEDMEEENEQHEANAKAYELALAKQRKEMEFDAKVNKIKSDDDVDAAYKRLLANARARSEDDNGN